MREAIVGPVKGLYVVAYACESAEDEELFLGGFKVYPFVPASSRVGGELAGEVSRVRYPSLDVALHHAKLKGAAAAEHLALARQEE